MLYSITLIFFRRAFKFLTLKGKMKTLTVYIRRTLSLNVPSGHGAFCIFLIFLRVVKDNDPTNDTEDNDSDNDDIDTRNSTICRMCSLL